MRRFAPVLLIWLVASVPASAVAGEGGSAGSPAATSSAADTLREEALRADVPAANGLRTNVPRTNAFGTNVSGAQLTGPEAAGPASMGEVLALVRLYGYRRVLEQSADRQLSAVLDSVRRERPNVTPDALQIIRQEMRGELRALSERSVNEFAEMLQKNLNRGDVVFLLRVGRDPHMRRLISLQPRIAQAQEDIGERLAAAVTRNAAPRIEARLKALNGDE